MEILIIIAGGLIGGGSSFKKDFIPLWVRYVNTVFALLPALGLTPIVSSMLELPFIPEGLRRCVAFFVLFIVCLLLLSKISEQILPKPEEIDKYPVAGGKIAGALFGFLMGCIYGALAVYLAGSIPVLNGVISSGAFKAAGAETLHRIAYSATFQTMPDEKTCLRTLNALEEVRKKNPAGKKEKNSSGGPEKKSSPRKKTQQEIDQEMLRKIESINQANTSESIQESGKDSFKKQFKKKKRKKKRKKISGSAFSASRRQSTAMQLTTAGAVYNTGDLTGPVPPDKNDLKRAAKEARRSTSEFSVAP